MNISSLLHSEIMLIAKQRAVAQNNAPWHGAPRVNMFNTTQRVLYSKYPKKYQRPQEHYTIYDDESAAADSLYMRVATLLEYNEIKLNLDQSLHYLFEEKRVKGKVFLDY